MAFVTARLNAALDAATNGVDHITLHTGAPGAAGTTNRAAGVDPSSPSGVGSATGAQDVWTGSWTIPGAGGPFTHFGAWDGDPDEGGTFVGDGTLDPEEEFAGAGTLNYSITVNGT